MDRPENVQLFRNLDELPDAFRHGAVSIGNFDGVHRGHARLVRRLVSVASRIGGPALVFTFDPHPAQLLRPAAAPIPLGWTQRNAQLLGELGVDAVLAYETNLAFLEIEARAFFDDILRRQLDARAMVEGPNFFFGHDRTGNVDLLRELCREAGIKFEVVEPLVVDGEIVSSSRIRQLVAAGQVAEAQELLGRPYRIRGEVVRGAGRGAGLGYPTANLEHFGNLPPGEGIYAGLVWVGHAAYPAAISVGPNPTFDEDIHKIEAFLLDYAGALYEQSIEVDFLARLRDIRRFGSADELVDQMADDVAAARRVVGQCATGLSAAEDV